MRYTIVTVNRNNAEGLRATIESVLAQTCTDWEYVVVDGASDDGSVEVIREYAARIAWWVSEPDGGIYPAMNKAIDHAHGDYTVFLNSGDRLPDSGTLESIRGCTADIIMGDSLNQCGLPDRRMVAPVTPYTFLTGICHQSTYYRTSLFRRRRYDESYRIAADWKLTYQFLFVDNCTVDVPSRFLSVFDTRGFSAQHPEVSRDELRRALLEMLPRAVVDDYLFFTSLRSPILRHLPYLITRYRMHRLAIWLVEHIVRASKWWEARHQ